MSLRHILLSLVLVGFVLSVAGCGSKVSKSNFDKIKTGMTVAEVEKILGKGEETSAGLAGLTGKVITWTDGDKKIIVTFVNDKVKTKVQQGL